MGYSRKKFDKFNDNYKSKDNSSSKKKKKYNDIDYNDILKKTDNYEN
jgi:hypothetical protein